MFDVQILPKFALSKYFGSISVWLIVAALFVGIGCSDAAGQEEATSEQTASVVEEQTQDTSSNAVNTELVDFKPAFEVGRVTYYQFEATVQVEQAIGEMVLAANTGTTLVMRVEVLSIDDAGNATVSLSYERVALTGENAFTGNFDCDTARAPQLNDNRQVAYLLERLKRAEITAIVTPGGDVTEATGTESVVAAMKRNDQLMGRSNEFSPEGISRVLRGFWLLGEEPRTNKQGDHWIEKQDTPLAGVGIMTFSSNFAIESVEKDTVNATLLLDVALELDPAIKKAMAAKEAANAEETTEPDHPTGDDHSTTTNTDHPSSGDDVVDEADAGEGESKESLIAEDPAKPEEAFTPSAPERVELNSDPKPGYMIWDRHRNELIERISTLNFTMETEQLEIFSQEMQISRSKYNIISTLRRIGTETNIPDTSQWAPEVNPAVNPDIDPVLDTGIQDKTGDAVDEKTKEVVEEDTKP